MKVKKEEIQSAVGFLRFGMFSLNDHGLSVYSEGINLIQKLLDELEVE